MTVATATMLGLGLICALWCIGLVLWIVYLDNAQRSAMIRLMNNALESILLRMGELHRQKQYRTDRPI